jgi:hypothetical protein
MPRVFETGLELLNSLKHISREMLDPIVESVEWAESRYVDSESEPKESIAGSEYADHSERAVIRERVLLLRDAIRRLTGDAFGARLRRALSRRHFYLGTEEARRDATQIQTAALKALADEAVRNPNVIEPEWPWLLQHRASWEVDGFINLLGASDVDRVLVDRLDHIGETDSRANDWLAIYEIAHARARGSPNQVDASIEFLLKKNRLEPAISLLLRSGYGPARAKVLTQLLAAGKVPPETLNALSYSPWASQLSALESHQLLDAALSQTDRPGKLLTFLWSFLRQHVDDSKELRPVAIQILLDMPKTVANATDTYQWSEIALIYIDDAQVELVKAALRSIGVHELAGESQLLKVINSAWGSSNREELFSEVIAPQLLEGTMESWWLRKALKEVPITELEPEFLIRWVSQDASRRANVLAEVIGAPSAVVSELHARMLTEFAAENVGSTFTAEFLSGIHVGPTSLWLRGKLAQAREWLTDERPQVHLWASDVVRHLEADLKRAESREREERVFD